MIFSSKKATRQCGFTLIELVAVIIILSVLGIMTSSFIGTGVDIYTGIAERDKSLNSVRFAMERLRREVSNALPNSTSVSATGQCLTFTPIIASSIYAGDFPISPQSADVGTIAPISIDIKNAKAVVYLLSQSELLSSKVQVINNYQAEKSTLTFPAEVSFPLGSPAKRVYFVRNNISYYFSEGKFLRGSECANGVLMANKITGSFAIGNATLQRNSLVQAIFNLDFDGKVVPVEQTLHINNVP